MLRVRFISENDGEFCHVYGIRFRRGDYVDLTDHIEDAAHRGTVFAKLSANPTFEAHPEDKAPKDASVDGKLPAPSADAMAKASDIMPPMKQEGAMG